MEIWNKLINRMLRAARLDSCLFEEVATDEEALGQAVMISLLASLATGIGMAITGLIGGKGPMWFVWGLLSGFVASLAGWFAWVVLTYLAATTYLRGPQKVNIIELTTALGFANSPCVLRIMMCLPLLGWMVTFLAGIWALASGTVALKQALDFSGGKALGANIIGWLVYMAMVLLVLFWIPSSYKMLPF